MTIVVRNDQHQSGHGGASDPEIQCRKGLMRSKSFTSFSNNGNEVMKGCMSLDLVAVLNHNAWAIVTILPDQRCMCGPRYAVTA